MKVLVACEFSGVVRDAFRARGHEAYSCDLLGSENPRYHLQGDCRILLGRDWDLMVAHPPCTYLANSGARWLHTQKGRWAAMTDATLFFQELLQAPIPRIAVENPIMHGHARKLIAKTYTQIIQPWQFGHGETKATCLWLKNLPGLVPTGIVDGRHARVHLAAPGPDRWKERSITLSGIAKAMAEQWG